MFRNAAIAFAVFLLGLLPPLVGNIRLKRELAAANARIEMAETGELAALSYVELTRNNFGVASDYAAKMFQRLEEVARSGDEPARSAAGEALRRRDSVMGMLATADPAARPAMQEIVLPLLSAGGETSARARAR